MVFGISPISTLETPFKHTCFRFWPKYKISDRKKLSLNSRQLFRIVMDNPTENVTHCGITGKSRLGECQQCRKDAAKYTCPACQTRTCSAKCVVSHKETAGCSGVRDKTAYKPMSSMTDLDLLSDYRLLEEVGRSVDICRRDVQKRNTREGRELPIHLYRLRAGAKKRGIFLHFMPPNFTRHKNNTTYLDWKLQKISWRVEWRFPQAKQVFVDERLSEDSLLVECVAKYIESPDPDSHPEMSVFRNQKLEKLKYFLHVEHEKGSSKRYYELNPTLSISENLKGRTIVEFPVITVATEDQSHTYAKAKSLEKPAKRDTARQVSEGEITSDSEDGEFSGSGNYFHLT